MKSLGLTVGLIILLLAGCGLHRENAGQSSAAVGENLSGEYYTCVMHPSVRSNRPGACPICGMTLVKVSAASLTLRNDTSSLGTVAISPRQRILANVQTVVVANEPMRKEINAVGVIDFAEPNLQHITMRFGGRLDRLFLTYTGQHVHRGEPVALVYSPEAISAQQEFILAQKSDDAGQQADSASFSNPASLIAQSTEKLLLMGFTSQQIATLRQTRKIENLVTIASPITGTVTKKYVDPQHYASPGEVIYDVADLSTVWMYADVYEQDIRFVKTGQLADITTDAYPSEIFAGTVKFIEPVMSGDTRTIRVRTEFANVEGKLKPQMYVTAKFYHVIPHTLVLPLSAVLMTGKRNVVWIEATPNVFEPRNVELGTRTDTDVEIISGLHAGEVVAKEGNFLIDSESSLEHPSRERLNAESPNSGKAK